MRTWSPVWMICSLTLCFLSNTCFLAALVSPSLCLASFWIWFSNFSETGNFGFSSREHNHLTGSLPSAGMRSVPVVQELPLDFRRNILPCSICRVHCLAQHTHEPLYYTIGPGVIWCARVKLKPLFLGVLPPSLWVVERASLATRHPSWAVVT